MTVSIASVSDIKSYLSIAEDETTDDVLLGTIVDAVNEYIETETGKVFEDPGVDQTRYFNKDRIDRDGILWLDKELYTITSVTNADDESINTSYIQSYPLNEKPINGIKLKQSSNLHWNFSYNDSLIAVTGRWCYSLTVPKTVKQAAIRLASWVYRQKDNASDVDRPILTGDGSVLMPSRFPNDIETWIESYKTEAYL